MSIRMIALALIISFICYADSGVDAVWSDQNGLFLGWIEGTTSWLESVQSGECIEVGQHGSNPGISIGLCESGSQELVAVALCDEVFYSFLGDQLALFSAQDLSPYASRELNGTDFGCSPSSGIDFGVINMELLENAGTPGELGLLSYSYITFTGTNHPTFSRWTSVNVDLSDIQALPFSDTLALERSAVYLMPSHDARLVSNPFGPPLYAFSDMDTQGGFLEGLTYIFSVVNEPQESRQAPEPEWECLYQQGVGYAPWPLLPSVLSFGSFSDGSLLLWCDTTEVMYASTFSNSPVPDSTYTYPFSQPDRFCESAMSSDTGLPGVLLAWHDEESPGTIRVRYFDGDWNGWAYTVAQDVAPLTTRGISVCGGEGGFWVAWLCTGAAEPDYVFVPLDDVEGIEDPGSGSDDVSLICRPNPFSSEFTMAVDGPAAGADLRCEVFDLTGRLVAVPFDSRWQCGAELSWDGSTREGSTCPSGTYLIRITSGSTSVTARAVLLR